MNTDDIEVYMDNVSDGSSYVESLVKARIQLEKLPHSESQRKMMGKLEEVILLELDLAVMGAEKAKSEILKAAAKDNVVRPIK